MPLPPRFCRAHAEQVEAVLQGDHAQLARVNCPPESFDTLLTRTVAALYPFRDVTERDLAGSGLPISTHLFGCSREACELWKQMEHTSGR